MGFVRGLGNFFGSFVFTTFLVIAVLLMGLIDFTSHDNFKSFASEIFNTQFSSVFDENYLNSLRSACDHLDQIILPVNDMRIVLDCNDVKSSNNTQLKNLAVSSLVDSLYYKKFGCSFVKCVTSGNYMNLLVVTANEGNMFYKNIQSYAWMIAGAGLIMLLLSTKTWAGRFRNVGFNLFFSGLPFIIFVYLQPWLISFLPPELASVAAPLIKEFSVSLRNKFLIILVIGIVLIVVGYAMKFYSARKTRSK